MNKKMKDKSFPVFETDKEAENFVDTADLSQYNFSEFKQRSMSSVIADFEKKHEFQRKQKSLYMRLPEVLFNAVKEKAKEKNIPYSRYIRMILEDSLSV